MQRSLHHLHLLTSYHKGVNDIAGEFYVPCLRVAAKLDRAVGYFNSSVHVVTAQGLSSFLDNGGTFRILTSNRMDPADVKAITGARSHPSQGTDQLQARLIAAIKAMLANPQQEDAVRLTGSMVALNLLDIKIVLPAPTVDEGPSVEPIFHDKLGLFHDVYGNTVAFRGSMNETWSGLSPAGNLEAVDVYLSWAEPRERERVLEEARYFELLWTDAYPSTRTVDFPEAARHVLTSAAYDNWKTATRPAPRKPTASLDPPEKSLRPHQSEALLYWNKCGQKGILDHATGGGKTLTALHAISQHLSSDGCALVVVPSELLLDQWTRELRRHFSRSGIRLLLAGAGHSTWRSMLNAWTRPLSRPSNQVVLATIQTASSHDFMSAICEGDHLLIVVDEVHRIGSARFSRLLQLGTGPRLGLSATPRRFGDPAGTQAIFAYFGDVLQPQFTLTDAIAAEVLTPYYYFVQTVELSAEEQDRWDALSARLQQLYAVRARLDNPSPDFDRRVRICLFQRRRLAKQASAKVPAAARVLIDHYRPGHKWLLYCDSRTQLRALRQLLSQADVQTAEYHYQMQGDRGATLRFFEEHGGVLLSMKCLDEGVDVPAATHALILSSSCNPREYIQRRGRVLRRSPGKSLAHVFDLLVLPSLSSAREEKATANLLSAEFSRAVEFASGASNSSIANDLRRIAIRCGISMQDISPEDFEDAD